MEQRQLGDSGLYTSAIGFGTWEMSTTMYGHIDVDEAAQAVHAAIDHGITLFDTAEVYGPYHSERLLAKALGNRRGDIVLVSKVGFQYDEDNRNAGRNSSYDHVIARTRAACSAWRPTTWTCFSYTGLTTTRLSRKRCRRSTS